MVQTNLARSLTKASVNHPHPNRSSLTRVSTRQSVIPWTNSTMTSLTMKKIKRTKKRKKWPNGPSDSKFKIRTKNRTGESLLNYCSFKIYVCSQRKDGNLMRLFLKIEILKFKFRAQKIAPPKKEKPKSTPPTVVVKARPAYPTPGYTRPPPPRMPAVRDLYMDDCT